MTRLSASSRDPALPHRLRRGAERLGAFVGNPWARAGSLGDPSRGAQQSRTPGPTPAPVRAAALGRGAAVALLALAACMPEIQGNGIFREETRSVPPFVGVTVKDPVIVAVTLGPEQSVRVSGDENVVVELDTSVQTDPVRQVPVLVVRVTDDFTPVHPLRVDVTVPELRLLRAEDQATVDASGAGTDLFAVEATDASVVRLAGSGGARLELSLSDARIDASGYPVTTAAVALVDGAKAELRASGAVTGTAAAGCTVENVGEGACQLTDGLGTPVTCAPR